MGSSLNLESLRAEIEADRAAARTSVTELKQKYLGRKRGLLSVAFERLTKLAGEDRQRAGRELNALKAEVEGLITAAEGTATEKAPLDLTVPPLQKAYGGLHPMTQVERELEQIFTSLGFSVTHGPEVESDWYNFEALNFPPDHPARDAQDTFYVQGGDEPLVMRTQTSPVQVRYMETHKPPFCIISAGKVYRNEATDATHEHTFAQMEGLAVGPGVTFSSMVWTIDRALKQFFGANTRTRLLPAYFPFVEPGAEVAISSPRFKNGKWIELLGCGMVHQNVFVAAGYPRGKYQGFAFGFGLSRFALMKYGIPDIRLLNQNDLDFLRQF